MRFALAKTRSRDMMTPAGSDDIPSYPPLSYNSSSDDDSAVTMPPLKLSLRATRGRCAKAVASPAYLRRGLTASNEGLFRVQSGMRS